MNKTPQWQEASEAIDSAQTILIVTHVRPDGDAMGSSLGLANALKQMGKEVTVAVDLGTPDFFSWLPNSETVLAELDSGSWDLMISTDCGDEGRSGKVGDYGRAHSDVVINIDHHRTNPYFGDIHLIETDGASASQIVYKLWQHMGINWTRDIAQPLLTGIVTDTLGFRTSSTTPQELQIAQELMQHGASLTEATFRTLGVMSSQELLLWKRVLPTVEIENGVVSANVTQADLKSIGLTYIDTGNLVGFLRSVSDVHVAVVFREDTDNTVKISFRSDPGFDVSVAASAMGGGGHKQAAGAEFVGTLADCRAKALPLAREAAQKGQLDIG
ncbi:MAG: bifunctional oligoribonuclease/PAP phosphatase NrnA [Phototrophicaceae bacterium]